MSTIACSSAGLLSGRRLRMARFWALALLAALGAAAASLPDWLGRQPGDPTETGWRYGLWLAGMTSGFAAAMLLSQWRAVRCIRRWREQLAASRRMQAALRESETRFRDGAEAASDWIWELDRRLRFTYLSERFETLTGTKSRQVVLDRTRWELAPEDMAADPAKWRQHRQTLENCLPFRDFIYSARLNPNGEARHFKVSGKPIYQADGQFQGYRGTGTDITEQIRAQAALHQSELRLRQVIDLVPHLIFAKDRHGRFLLANRATAAAYGLPVEALAGRLHHEVHPVSAELARMARDDAEVIAGWGSKQIVEEPFTDCAGQVRMLQTMKIPFIEPGLHETAVLSVAIDITAEKRAKQEAAQMRLYLRNIIDSMPSVLIGVDPDGGVTVLNQAAEQASGLSWAAAQGQFFGAAFPSLADQAEAVRQAIRQGQPVKTPRLSLENHGKLHYADLMIYPLVAEGARGAVIRLDDVTARAQIEAMMVQTEKMLSVGGLAAGMAHEINNPLGAILQGSQNILRRLSPDLPQNWAVAQAIGIDLEHLRRYLEQRQILRFLEGIREAGIRAAKIVADMLSFSRHGAAQIVTTELDELLETVLRLAANDYDLKHKYDFSQITIIRDHDPNLSCLQCDKIALEQVLLNLVKNAAQALASAATPIPTITLRTQREAEHALIEVIDNGPGMDEATLKRVFEPFFTTKEPGVGTGLGLSVSYFLIAEQHGGQLSVHSKPGQGARFSIRLPLRQPAKAAGQPTVRDPTAGESTP